MTPPTEHEEAVTAQGLRVVELFTACAADPDDLAAAAAADAALAQLDALLLEAPTHP